MTAGPRPLDQKFPAYRASLAAERQRERVVLAGVVVWGSPRLGTAKRVVDARGNVLYVAFRRPRFVLTEEASERKFRRIQAEKAAKQRRLERGWRPYAQR